jgi:hypothetical protein
MTFGPEFLPFHAKRGERDLHRGEEIVIPHFVKIKIYERDAYNSPTMCLL